MIFLVFISITGLRLALSNLPISSNEIVVNGVIEKRSDNYIILNSFKGRFYLQSYNNEYERGDIVSVNGKVNELEMHSIESVFDFKVYLNDLGVKYEIKSYKINVIYHRYFRPSKIIDNILSNFSEDNKALIGSIVFARFDDDLTSGSLGYLLSISGVHIYLLLSLVSWINLTFRVKKKYRFLTYIPLIPYFLLISSSFALIRIMFSKLILWIIKKKDLEKQIDGRSLSYLLLALIDPFLVYQTRFLAPLVASKIYSSFYVDIKDSYFIKFSISFILYIVLSLIIFTHYEINLIAIFLRVLLTPINVLLIVLTLLGLLLPFIIPIITLVSNFYLAIINNKFIDFFSISIGQFDLFMAMITIMLILIFFYFIYARIKKGQYLSFSVLVFSLSLFSLPIMNQFRQSIRFIDVGQGDCILIENRNKYALIDTGGNINFDIASDCLLPYLKKNRINTIETVFITHSDYDHVGALNNLSKLTKINEVVTSFSSLNRLGISFTNLNNKIYSNENDNSLVIYFEFMDKNWLMMGDASKNVEKDIIGKIPSKIDVIKIGHHGSNTSTSEEFIKSVAPKEAILSLGYKNKYGHPHDEVITTLLKYGVIIRRTDVTGTIVYKKYVI